ncbi:tail fiber protein [Burkholderia phage BcepF1]|uniref:Tail fiber protein n=1 Tax=Burkholderia phage BcepF1 TaxID=2886897 RepID=A1Z000_9CAUD|nr:tail protein [Burkholderia phage BcepF1]ABL96827.1 tail fiber protein [Burkholderia phage BcepF1]
MFTPPLITVPWAKQGDTIAIPTAADPNGFVNFTTGYTADYEISLKSGNPKAKAVERRIQNQLFSILTQNVQAWQQMGFPAWDSGMPGGYVVNAIVVRQNAGGDWMPYRSTTNNNVSDPQNSTTWQYFEFSSETLSHIPMPVGGGSGTGIVASATDFNTFRRGTWYIPTDAIAAASPNSPVGIAGMLESRDVDSGNTVTVQIYTDRNGRVYTRGATQNGATYTAWQESINRRGDTTTGAITLAANSKVASAPAQFDSTTNLPNTSWVNRELGSYSGYKVLANATVLDVSYAGAMSVYGQAAAAAVTMPDQATFTRAGAAISIFNLSSTGALTVNAAAGKTLLVPGAAVTSIVLQPGDSAVFVAQSTGFVLVAGTASLAYSGSIVPTLVATDNTQRIANAAWVRANFVSSLNPTFNWTATAKSGAAAGQDAAFIADANDATHVAQFLLKRGTTRYQFYMDATAEGAGDTGSNLALNAMDNTGTFKFTLMNSNRTNGIVNFPQGAQVAGSTVWSQATLNKLSQLTNDVPYVARGTAANAANGPSFGDVHVTGGISLPTQGGANFCWNEDNGGGATSIINNPAGGVGGIRLRNVNANYTVELCRWDVQSNGTLKRVSSSTQSNILEDAVGGTYLQNDGNLFGTVWGGALSTYIFNQVNARVPRGSGVVWNGGNQRYGPAAGFGEIPSNMFLTGVTASTGEATANAIYMYARYSRVD